MAIISRRIWRAAETRRRIMTDAVRSRHAPGCFLRLRNGQTHYQLDKHPDKPLLVCIHGWSTASYVWDPLKPWLRSQGYRVLTYDLYGRGFSDRPEVDHTAMLFTDQLTELLDKLSLNKAPLYVVGYSMGGAIAARFVAQRLKDVKRLLLIAPAGMAVRAPGLRDFVRRNPDLSNPHILTFLPLALRRQFRTAAADFMDDKAVRGIFCKQVRELDYRGYLPALLSSLNGVLASRMVEEHRTIANSRMPVRALFAEKDRTIPIGDAKCLFDKWHGQGASVEIPDVGHALTYTHPSLIENAVGDFLQQPGGG